MNDSLFYPFCYFREHDESKNSSKDHEDRKYSTLSNSITPRYESKQEFEEDEEYE